MGSVGTYLGLMFAAWGMQLCPRVYLGSGNSSLRLHTSSITWAFIEANIYTLCTTLIILMPSKMFTTHQQRNFKCLFVMPYLLHYITCFCGTAKNIKELLTSPEMLAVKDYAPIHLKMILIFGLQLMTMIEMVFVLFYILRKEPQKLAKSEMLEG
ncbi:uncharacterized protein LOC108093050 [Drosophila ficusphila]|uniref:uncharacterized protein LOC108093050 n=1 Tax=Drosophila ficusphila TaxID=30025 RepID=UPI0007E72C1B|nr:uncharacterized protein LOC108093050 [Drosophila ficusphila]